MNWICRCTKSGAQLHHTKFMKFSIWTPFFVLACIGWLIACIVHILLLLDVTIPFGVIALHIGIFVVFIPFVLRLVAANGRYEQIALNKVFQHAPLWMKILAIGSWAYGIINFIVHNPKQGGTHLVDAQGLLLFSGGWIAFYGISMAGLYPEKAASVST